MAPNSMLIVLLVAFAVAAPPSMAARDGGAAKAAEAPAPSAIGGEVLHTGGELLHTMDMFGDIMDMFGDIIVEIWAAIWGVIGQFDKDLGELPDLPLPRILPCPPAFPIKIPLIPCHNATSPPPPVAECRSSLVKYMPPCAGFLTDKSPPSPEKKCCAAAGSFFKDDSTTPMCLCHIVNGDAGKVIYQAPVNHTRALNFLNQCGLDLTSDQVSQICSDHALYIPPMDAPSPSPAPSDGTKAGSP